MKTTVLLILVLLTITVTFCINEKTEDERKLCKKESRRVLKQIVKEMGICNDKMKKSTKDSKEHSQKMGCVVRCILEMENMLDKNGLVTAEIIDSSIGERATGKRRVDVLKLITMCMTKHGKDLDPSDPLCKAYAVFGLCVQGAVADMCDIPPAF